MNTVGIERCFADNEFIEHDALYPVYIYATNISDVPQQFIDEMVCRRFADYFGDCVTSHGSFVTINEDWTPLLEATGMKPDLQGVYYLMKGNTIVEAELMVEAMEEAEELVNEELPFALGLYRMMNKKQIPKCVFYGSDQAINDKAAEQYLEQLEKNIIKKEYQALMSQYN
jgi:hypothetical protein